MKIISINAGSSSLKFSLFNMENKELLISGTFERIGLDGSFVTFKLNDEKIKKEVELKNHEDAVKVLLNELIELKVISSLEEIDAVGHRLVHGGDVYSESVVITDEVMKTVDELSSLAPLHNPANLVGVKSFKAVLPNIPMVGVFDTAFHQTMEPQDFMYACPYEYYEDHMVRRYGAHGTSHKYLAEESFKYLEGVKNPKVISCHIGSGASICAIKDGKCVTTSMGLSPLVGVMMGTRTGDIDASVIPYLCKQTGKSVDEIYSEFNKKSGLIGISGVSNDTRDVVAGAKEGNERCILALQMYTRRIVDYIGQYYARLGGCDLIIFSAGVGENGPEHRTMICDELKEAFGVQLSEELNAVMRGGKEGLISTVDSKIKVAVIPTDEEVMIARDVIRLANI